MKIFEKLRSKIGQSVLHNQVATQLRSKQFNNFGTAKSAGVLFDATKLEKYNIARDFIHELEEKKIKTTALGYTLTHEAALFFVSELPLLEGELSIFSGDDLNWYFRPKPQIIESFCEQEFDLLIDLSSGNDLPIAYVVGLSRAKLKIGKESPFCEYYDFTLALHDTDAKAFLKQLKHYLGAISTKQQNLANAQKTQF